MTQWKKLLKSFGFSESEANVYLTSLEMGPSSVQDIAKRAKVSRVTTYAMIEALSKRGLMSSVEKDRKKMFVAESPERLVSFANARVKEMEGALHEVEASMHELKLIQRGEKPVVKMFEGPEALNAVINDIANTKPKEIFEFGNLDDFKKIYKLDVREKTVRRIEQSNAKRRFMYIAKDELPIKRSVHEEFYVLPEDNDFHGDVTVYGNKVGLSTLIGKQISILIESAVLADTIRSMMNLIWKKRT